MKRVAWGLLAAWIIHDLEELVTMSRWSHQAPAQLAEALDRISPVDAQSTSLRAAAAAERALPMSATEAATAIGLTGLAMAAASAAGAATGGRSKFFQASLVGFGLHAGTHIAQSVALRRYTPGLVTTPLVVIPYSVWAWRQLKRAGVPIAPSDRRLNLALAAVVPLSHAIARLPRLRRRGREGGVRPTMNT
ncbi:HXXEE domain-containing protein [Kribbella sp. NBC_01505]|uniref:HXXEE domain-containing protein n=1 Tax=Kribbella sp. NBC_01505 TaxID=2903580 RepID=UPI00386E66DE